MGTSKLTKDELLVKLKRSEKYLNDAYKKLSYYEKVVGAARAYRILKQNLQIDADGCMVLDEDCEFLDKLERELDKRLDELHDRPWRKHE